MRTRRRHIALHEAKAGMVLCAPLNIVNHGILRCSFPAGHVLTADNLNQLAAHHGEFLFISEDDPRTEQQAEADAAHAAERVKEIFSATDLTNPVTAALQEQVLVFLSTV